MLNSFKYINHNNGRPLDAHSDSCALADWKTLHGQAFYALHEDGFKIFLAPGRIQSSDEYLHEDPYAVGSNLESQFQLRRKELTLELLKYAVDYCPNPPEILDLGCGQGHITENLRMNLSTALYSGLDYSVSAIAYAHNHFKNIDFIVADAYDTPYANEYFDVVICNNLWEHVPDPLNLLAEIKRILKSKGWLIISTPSRYRFGNIVRILRGKPVGFMSSYHVTEYSVGQIKEQLNYGGFAVIKTTTRKLTENNIAKKIIKEVVEMFLKYTGSHHQLESTIFYLAQKNS